MPRSLVAVVTNALRNLRYNYLFLPGVIAVALGGAAAGLVQIDETGGANGILAVFPSGPPAARGVLVTIAGAIATVAGVAFSLTIISLQLVSQQFTPRALRGFLGDRLNQTIAGVFIGVVLYCLVALQWVKETDPRFVPGLTVTLAVFLAFVALALLLVFIHHMGHSIQVSKITNRIAGETVALTASPYPSSYGADDASADADEVVASWEREREPVVVYVQESGFVQSVDDVPATIEGKGFRIELLVAPGEFVTPRHPVARVWTEAERDACAAAMRRAIAVGAERDFAQDIGYGLRQLADIAVKALSPSVNDPTTATTCIGYLQAILERVATAPRPGRVRRFAHRDVTIVMPRDSFSDYLEAFVQISRYATDARVIDALLRATLRVAKAAMEADALDRAQAAGEVAGRIARRALASDSLDDEERETVSATLAEFPVGGAASG